MVKTELYAYIFLFCIRMIQMPLYLESTRILNKLFVVQQHNVYIWFGFARNIIILFQLSRTYCKVIDTGYHNQNGLNTCPSFNNFNFADRLKIYKLCCKTRIFGTNKNIKRKIVHTLFILTCIRDITLEIDLSNTFS